MKTKEEIHSLIQAFQTVTKALTSATVIEDSHDRVLIAMLLMPLLPALDEFLASLGNEIRAAKEPKEDPLERLVKDLKANGIVS